MTTNAAGSRNRLPPLYISHGSPMIALEPGAAGHFMQRLGPAITATFGRPRAILAASAHSLAREPVLLAAPRHTAVHDFGGFDPRLCQMRYDAPGAPDLAAQVMVLLQQAGLAVHSAGEGGLDHGIWTPLRYMFPEATVPVLPLAWPPDWSPARLFALGQALAPLADDGVLVIGTGSITHNLRRVFANGRVPAAGQPDTPESDAFRTWFANTLTSGDRAALLDYRRRAPHAALMHPTDEHLLPWFVAAGAGAGMGIGMGTNGIAGQRIHASSTHGDLGMDAYAFGPAALTLAAVPSLLLQTVPSDN